MRPKTEAYESVVLSIKSDVSVDTDNRLDRPTKRLEKVDRQKDGQDDQIDLAQHSLVLLICNDNAFIRSQQFRRLVLATGRGGRLVNRLDRLDLILVDVRGGWTGVRHNENDAAKTGDCSGDGNGGAQGPTYTTSPRGLGLTPDSTFRGVTAEVTDIRLGARSGLEQKGGWEGAKEDTREGHMGPSPTIPTV